MELPYMNTVYITFGLFLLVTAYNYLKPTVERNYTGLKTAEAWELIKDNKNLVLIDVRSAADFRKNRIKGARNIPIEKMDEKKNTLPRDKDIVLYCQNGGRSVRAIRLLELAGYTRLYNMDEGLRGWTRAGHPIRGSE